MHTSFSVNAADPRAEQAAAILATRLRERDVTVGPAGRAIELAVDETMAQDAYSIADDGDGLRISAGGGLGLLHGAGRLLRDAAYTNGRAEPGPWRGTHTPHASVRGVYLATHFFNFYHVAPLGEMRRYLEDLALWGYNYIEAVFPHPDMTGPDDPAIGPFLDRLNAIFAAAHELGMKVATALVANATYPGFPEEYRAAPLPDPTGLRGNFGQLVCPSNPAANRMLMEEIRALLERMKPAELDMIISCPYDEGGCGCANCHPWGANGFIRTSRQIFEISREIFPDIQRCVMTWVFDDPYEGEWEGLYAALEGERWCDLIQADSHTDFPRFPLQHPNPAGLPVINFPEVSMWGLYPWGGWGATALPERFTRLWRQASRILDGGFVYSEGVFEDVNKAVISQLYADGDADWRETLAQYARYELGVQDVASFVQLISLIERTHTSVAETGRCAVADAERAHTLAKLLDSTMPRWGRESWRWRLILLRTLLDAHRYRVAQEVAPDGGWPSLDWRALLRDDPAVQAAFREIIGILHSSESDRGDLYHSRVRPLAD